MCTKAWPIKRKNITFIAKPNPGSYKAEYVVPVVVLLRDILGVAETSKEVKMILHNRGDVLLNG
jgi:small subunit ribosomal protein S4e